MNTGMPIGMHNNQRRRACGERCIGIEALSKYFLTARIASLMLVLLEVKAQQCGG